MTGTAAFDPEDPEQFKRMMESMSLEEFVDFIDTLPPAGLTALVRETSSFSVNVPQSPLEQAMALDPKFESRPHLEYLSDRIAMAVKDVENGISRQLMVAMPPRSGKSAMVSENLPVWLIRQHPAWKYALLSYTPTLAVDWSRKVRAMIARYGVEFGVSIAPDAGAVGDWKTTAGGEVHARSIGQGMTGFGATVLLIDDPIKDSITAHSANYRKMIWEKWTANLQTRREPPSLTIIVQTRWHEDDLSGRLQNPEVEGAVPADWEVISFPAIAEDNDVLGRTPGDPLYPPLLPLDREKALAWWNGLKSSMSSYDWSAQYQQRPSPSQGAVFNTDWWRFWTTDPALVTYAENEEGELVPDGRIILLPDLTGARHLDSWDLNFDDTVNSDFVVGQRWAMLGTRRFLLDQRRGRWDFPTTLAQFEDWNLDGVVHEHLIEKKANGAAMIAMMSHKYTNIKPVNPTTSKEVRARAITADLENGYVYLPHPSEKAFVKDLLDECREFPSGAHDDQVDVLTQALAEMRDPGFAGMTNPATLVSSRKGYQPGGTVPGMVTVPPSPLTAARIDRRFGGSPGFRR